MLRVVFLAFLGFGLVACGDDGIGPEDIVGTYGLQSIDGEGLPAVFSEIGATVLAEVTAGSVTLNEDMTCSSSLTIRREQNGTVTTSVDAAECTYTFNSGAITLTFPAGPAGGSTTSGSISGSMLTLIGVEGVVLVYQKLSQSL